MDHTIGPDDFSVRLRAYVAVQPRIDLCIAIDGKSSGQVRYEVAAGCALAALHARARHSPRVRGRRLGAMPLRRRRVRVRGPAQQRRRVLQDLQPLQPHASALPVASARADTPSSGPATAFAATGQPEPAQAGNSGDGQRATPAAIGYRAAAARSAASGASFALLARTGASASSPRDRFGRRADRCTPPVAPA